MVENAETLSIVVVAVVLVAAFGLFLKKEPSKPATRRAARAKRRKPAKAPPLPRVEGGETSGRGGDASDQGHPQSSETTEHAVQDRYDEGERVLALWKSDSWHPGVIISAKALGGGGYSYSVEYDDGERETQLTPASLRRLAQKVSQHQEPARKELRDLPDLDGCVAYQKDGVQESSALTTRLTEDLRKSVIKPPAVENEEDDDDFAFDIVQSVSEWKKAAPKPRKPPVVKEPPPKKKVAATSDTAEKNRKKRERQKAHKLVVREAMRARL